MVMVLETVYVRESFEKNTVIDTVIKQMTIFLPLYNTIFQRALIPEMYLSFPDSIKCLGSNQQQPIRLSPFLKSEGHL